MNRQDDSQLQSLTSKLRIHSPTRRLDGDSSVLRKVDEFFSYSSGSISLHPAEIIRTLPKDELRYWMHMRGVYSIPTVELVEWLNQQFGSWRKRTIEIGAGTGLYGRWLEIPMTDNWYQRRPEVHLLYDTQKQPTIVYPTTVECLSGIEAVEKYRPHTVFASWVTQRSYRKDTPGCAGGVDWELLLPKVKRLIFVGSDSSHYFMSILKMKHEKYRLPFIVSRAENDEDNFVAVWKNRDWKP